MSPGGAHEDPHPSCLILVDLAHKTLCNSTMGYAYRTRAWCAVSPKATAKCKALPGLSKVTCAIFVVVTLICLIQGFELFPERRMPSESAFKAPGPVRGDGRTNDLHVTTLFLLHSSCQDALEIPSSRKSSPGVLPLCFVRRFERIDAFAFATAVLPLTRLAAAFLGTPGFSLLLLRKHTSFAKSGRNSLDARICASPELYTLDN